MLHSGKDLEITIEQLKVSYNDVGSMDNPAIVFIHGFPLNKSMWDRQLDALQDEFRVIAYDVRGHGSSDAGASDFSIDIFVSDLLSLMQALKVEKPLLCGLSMGGYIALNAIENYPELFESIVLCATQCLADSPEAKAKRLLTMNKIQEKGVEVFADESLPKFFTKESVAAKTEEIALVREMIVNISAESLCNTIFALSSRHETCSKLVEINVPALIIVGKEDEITPVALSEFLHHEISGSSLKVIEGAAHLVNMEKPMAFNEQVKKFASEFAKKRALANK
jgi:3-oxoadipate enol-lactonase